MNDVEQALLTARQLHGFVSAIVNLPTPKPEGDGE